MNPFPLPIPRGGREAYADLVPRIVDRRAAVEALLAWLETETSWLTAPASAAHHLCCEGGLVLHSVNVARILLRLREALAPSVSEESCILTALFHDVGKVGEPGEPLYLPSQDGPGWPPYIVNPGVTALGVAIRSLHLVGRFVPLHPAEVQAIACHDGQYVPANWEVAHREAPLTVLLHYADYWACHVVEAGNDGTRHPGPQGGIPRNFSGNSSGGAACPGPGNAPRGPGQTGPCPPGGWRADPSLEPETGSVPVRAAPDELPDQ